MVPNLSRRALLAGVATGTAVGVAGCGDADSGGTTRATPTDGVVDGTLLTDIAAVTVRSPGQDPTVVAPREDRGDDGTADPVDLHTVGSESEVEAIEFAPDAAGAEAARDLLAATAYDEASVLLHQTPVRECHRLRLQYAARDDDGDPDLQFCSAIRDADVDCETGERDHAAAFVRLPIPAEEYGGYSVGLGSNCGPVPEPYRGSESA